MTSINSTNYAENEPLHKPLNALDIQMEEDANKKEDSKRKHIAWALIAFVVSFLVVGLYFFLQEDPIDDYVVIYDECFYDESSSSRVDGDDAKGKQTPMDRKEFVEGWVDGSKHPDGIRAICNDLSVPGYYHKPAQTGVNDKNYVVYIPGGSGCWDLDTCNERWEVRPDDMEANMDATKLGRGITNSDQYVKNMNSFKDWHMSWADYCSSDGFIGRMDIDDPANPCQGVWHFGGDSIFWAYIESLLINEGMSAAENIIITSSSAGAEGTFQQMDRLKDYLAVNAPNANVKFAYDNGWHISYVNDTLPTSGKDEGENRADMFTCWNPNLNDDCYNYYKDYPGQEYMCLYTGDILYPFLKHKDFHLHMHQFDFMQHSAYGVLPGNWLDWDEETSDFAHYLGALLVDSARATDEVTSFTFPACREHDDFDKKGWACEAMEKEQDSGEWTYNLPEFIWEFMMNGEIYRTWDTCADPYCNPTCGLLPYDAPGGCTFC